VSRAARVGIVGFVGLTSAVVAWVLGTDPIVPDLIVLATAITVGELVELHPANRAALPLSFAVFTVLVRAGTPPQVLVVVLAAEVLAAALRPGPMSVNDRLMKLAERCAEAFSAGAVYQAVIALAGSDDQLGVVLGALAAASIAPIVVSDFVNYVDTREIAPVRARGADVALVTSGILMAVGYEGIDGRGQLGLWGPVLFSVPLIAAWYSLELLASTRRSYLQTVRALAAAPELGGLVRAGHSERVAELAGAMGRTLDLSLVELDHLDTAARLHHLGAVCLDEPDEGQQLDPIAVATSGAQMLRASDALAPAGDVVAAEPLLHRPPGRFEVRSAALSGMILKVASAYDELTEGDDEHAAWAVEALYTGPGYVYDGRVLGALERVLERRKVLSPSR
jgi:hypothetical protein